MKFIYLKKYCLIVLLLFNICAVNAQGFLKAKGSVIVDGKGEKYILRGMGLGGWLLQEGYMFRLGFIGQQYRIREKIEDVVGRERAAAFYESWITNHTTKADIDSMGAWGFNSIRLPMHFALYTLPVDKEPVAGKNTWIEKGFAITDSLLKWCAANHMYLILDLHATPGGQGNDLPISDRDSSKPSLWQSDANQQKMIALWSKLAKRYANEQWIGGYDIINEPNWGFEDMKDFRGTAETKNIPLRKLMMDITKAIREVDKNHIIIIEGNGFGNNYRGIFPAWDDNLVISFHKYGNFNTPAAINSFLELRKQNNIPLWLGESGENSNTWFTEAIRMVESYDIGWAWWQEKKMGVNNPLEIVAPKGYEQLTRYWSGKGEKPDAETAWNILQQLSEQIKIANNRIHYDVLDAMFRQVHENTSKPFVQHRLSAKLYMNAADYDLGSQRIAYYDLDTSRYQYTPGVNTDGNRGHSYRNDGVDVQNTPDGAYVFNIENGEWLQYTVNVEKGGSYQLSFETAAEKAAGKFSFLEGQTELAGAIEAPVTNGMTNWQWSTPRTIQLHTGVNHFRVLISQGGFNLRSIRISH
jgi:endoglucanase